MPAGASAHGVYWSLMQLWHHCSSFSRWRGGGSLVITERSYSHLSEASDIFKCIRACRGEGGAKQACKIRRGGQSGRIAGSNPLFRPPQWILLLLWFWKKNVGRLRTVYLSQLSCVAWPRNRCLLMQWAGLQEGWLAAMERLPVRLWLHVVLRDQALSHFVHISFFSLPFCIIVLWPYLEWVQIRRIRTESGMCMPDQQLVMFLNAK